MDPERDGLTIRLLSSAAGALLEPLGDKNDWLYCTITLKDGDVVEREWTEGQNQPEEGTTTYIMEGGGRENMAITYLYDRDTMDPGQRTVYYTDESGDIKEAIYDESEEDWNTIRVNLTSTTFEDFNPSINTKLSTYISIEDSESRPVVIYQNIKGHLCTATPTDARHERWEASLTKLFEQTGAKPVLGSPISTLQGTDGGSWSDLVVFAVDERDETVHEYTLDSTSGNWTDKKAGTIQHPMDGLDAVSRILAFSNGEQTDIFYKTQSGKIYFLSRKEAEPYGESKLQGSIGSDGHFQPPSTAQSYLPEKFVHMIRSVVDSLLPESGNNLKKKRKFAGSKAVSHHSRPCW